MEWTKTPKKIDGQQQQPILHIYTLLGQIGLQNPAAENPERGFVEMKDKRCSILWSPCHQLTETNPYYKKEKEYDPFLSSVFGLFIYLFTIYIFLDIFIFNRLHVCLLFIRFDFFIRVDFIGYFVVHWEPTAKTGS